MLTGLVWICTFYFTISRYNVLDAKITYNTRREERTRVTPYQPVVISKTCLLKPDTGPCRSEIPMFYYDPPARNCSLFFWGGCQGNGNRFDTHKDCVQTCLSRPNHPKRRPKWCSLNFDYGFCFGSIDRWYYDPLWKVCKQRIYSGCGGNKNNFYNKEQCNSICSFGTGVIKTVVKDRSGVKRILIVNPPNATTKRGKHQISSIENHLMIPNKKNN